MHKTSTLRIGPLDYVCRYVYAYRGWNVCAGRINHVIGGVNCFEPSYSIDLLEVDIDIDKEEKQHPDSTHALTSSRAGIKLSCITTHQQWDRVRMNMEHGYVDVREEPWTARAGVGDLPRNQRADISQNRTWLVSVVGKSVEESRWR